MIYQYPSHLIGVFLHQPARQCHHATTAGAHLRHNVGVSLSVGGLVGVVRQVVGRAVVGPVLKLVVHAPGVVLGMKRIVGVVLVGTDHRSRGDEAARQLDHIGLVLVLQHEGQGLPGPGQFLASQRRSAWWASGSWLSVGLNRSDFLFLGRTWPFT